MNKSLNRAQEAFLRLVRNRAYNSAFNALKQMHPADLARLLPYMQAAEQKWFVDSILKARKLGGVVSEIDERVVPEFLNLITEEQFAAALQDIDPDDIANIINIVPEERRQTIFERLSGSQKKAVGKLLGYAPDTAGGIMTTEFLALPETLSVAEAVDRLRKEEKPEEIHNVYIIDANEQLVGVVSFRDLVICKADRTLGEIMEKDPVAVRPHANQELVADMIARYNLLSIPVIDENHRLIGRITVDDAIDVLREEATEDIYHLASLSTEDHVSTPVFTSTRRRIPWLLVNLGASMLGALTVSLFSETISQYVVLAVLMPIVANMGNNSGIQSLTVVVRSLALGEVDWSLGFKVVMKEISVGFLNGIITGVIMGFIALVWYQNLWLAVIMAVAMITTLAVSGLVGAFVPLILRKLKQDPALGSSIFVTAASDVGGFSVFLGLATLLIKWIL